MPTPFMTVRCRSVGEPAVVEGEDEVEVTGCNGGVSAVYEEVSALRCDGCSTDAGDGGHHCDENRAEASHCGSRSPC